MTYLKLLCESTSRSNRDRTLGPTTLSNRRLPPIPSLTTDRSRLRLIRRSANLSGHRRLALPVEPTPSVIESPIATTALVVLCARTSIDDRKKRPWEVDAIGSEPALVIFPVPTAET